MRNTGLDEAQAGIKIARRNINNLRYADDTILMAESEEDLKSLLMKVRAAAATVKSLQSCPTLCDLIDGSSPGSPVPGILQARTLEWVVISFSNAWKWKVKVKSLSCVQLLVTPWTAAHQAPLSMGIFQARVLEWDAIAFSESERGEWKSWLKAQHSEN